MEVKRRRWRGVCGAMSGSRFAWEADTLPAELLPLGRLGRSPAARIYHHSPVIGEGVTGGAPEKTIRPTFIPGPFPCSKTKSFRDERSRQALPQRAKAVPRAGWS
jgi:hypothetical protein